jgi:hypothetical protein
MTARLMFEVHPDPFEAERVGDQQGSDHARAVRAEPLV